MLDTFALLFSQSFLMRALIVGVLISLCCALLGVSLVLKRFSMIGDGLSHVAFGAMAIACAANVAPLYFSLPIVLVAAFLLLRMNEKGKIKGDAAIALISTGALAVGVMVTSMTTGMNIDIYNYMFGSILAMSDSDVVISVIISVVVSALFLIFYNEIFSVTFDESFAQATGTKTSVYNMLLAGLTAVTIVIGMRMMGALLISSLIIFPSVTSMRLCKSFKSVVISSTIVSIVCFVTGLIFSVRYEAPTGASVVCINIILLVLFIIASKLRAIMNKKAFIASAVGGVIVTIVLLFLPSFVLSSGSENTNKLRVVTVGFAEYDFARQIMGNRGDVSMLLSPGEESHTYEPTPADILRINECDIFICTGGESESWVKNILESVENDMNVIKMMDICTLEESEHAHVHSHEGGTENEEYDEHVWTSPVNAKLIVEAVSSALCKTDGKNAEYYKRNTASYLKKLDALDASFRTLAGYSNNKYVVIGDRFPLRYLMLEYGIGYKSAFPGCSAQAEVNPVTIAELNGLIKSDNIPVVFKVDLSNGTVADSISRHTGAVVDTLYSGRVISYDDFNNGETYISLMQRNLNALTVALN